MFLVSYWHSEIISLKGKPIPYKIVQTKKGLLNLQNIKNGQFVHSNFDPKKEAERFIASIIPKIKTIEKTKIICFGFGIGYHIEEFLYQAKAKIRFICIEPDFSIFKIQEVEEQKNRISFLYQKNSSELIILENTKSLKEYINQENNHNFYFFSHPYYSRNYSDMIQEIQSFLTLKNRSIHESTTLHFAKSWFRNYIINLKNINQKKNSLIFNSKDFSFLKDKTVVFCGASPILENQIDWLKRNRNFYFLISSDTSCYYLQKNGLKVDLIFSVDSGRGTLYHFRDDLDKEIPIMTWLGTNPNIIRLHNPTIIYLSTFPLDQILDSILDTDHSKILQNPSMNIAGLAKSFCEFLYVERLIFCGIDFQAHFGKTHCKGTGYENYMLGYNNRFLTIQSYIPITYKSKISSKNKISLNHLKQKTNANLKIEFLNDITSTINANLILNKIEYSGMNINVKEFYGKLKTNEIQNELANMLKMTRSVLKRYINL